jgi:hypothetical protein
MATGSQKTWEHVEGQADMGQVNKDDGKELIERDAHEVSDMADERQ